MSCRYILTRGPRQGLFCGKPPVTPKGYCKECRKLKGVLTPRAGFNLSVFDSKSNFNCKTSLSSQNSSYKAVAQLAASVAAEIGKFQENTNGKQEKTNGKQEKGKQEKTNGKQEKGKQEKTNGKQEKVSSKVNQTPEAKKKLRDQVEIIDLCSDEDEAGDEDGDEDESKEVKKSVLGKRAFVPSKDEAAMAWHRKIKAKLIDRVVIPDNQWIGCQLLETSTVYRPIDTWIGVREKDKKEIMKLTVRSPEGEEDYANLIMLAVSDIITKRSGSGNSYRFPIPPRRDDAQERSDKFAQLVTKDLKYKPGDIVVTLDGRCRNTLALVKAGVRPEDIYIFEMRCETWAYQRAEIIGTELEKVNIIYTGKEGIQAHLPDINTKKVIAIYLDFCGGIGSWVQPTIESLSNLKLLAITRAYRNNSDKLPTYFGKQVYYLKGPQVECGMYRS